MKKYNLLYSNNTILSRIEKIKNIFREDFKEFAGDKVFICVLKGAYPFFTHFVQDLIPFGNTEIQFITVSTYENNEQKKIPFPKWVGEEPGLAYFKNKHVIIVEDIVESGETVRSISDFIYKNFEPPKSINLVSLCYKPDITPKDLPYDKTYYVLPIPEDQFVVGFGMDNNEKERDIDWLISLDKEKI